MRPGMRLKVMLVLCLICEKSSSVFPGFLFPGTEGPTYNGDLSPMDPEVCTDTYEDFLCTLDSEPEANRSLGFAIQTNMSGFFPVNKKNITVFNDSMIKYHHYFDPYVKTVKFKCYYWADDETWGQIDESLEVGLTSFPDIFTKPEKVKDLNCVVQNYVESMNCSWNYGIDYPEGKPIVLFEWRIPTLSGSWNPCPSLYIDSGYCYWNSTRAGDFSLKVIDIRLTLTQYCNMSVTSNITIDTRDHVKPGPVVALSSAPVNSTCINVTWNTTRRAYLKIHNVIATSKWGDLHEEEYTTNSTTEEQSQNITFCNLQEDTEYIFSVKVKPISKGYWSDIKTVASKTFPDVPGASPEIGGYAWEPKDCQEKKTRSVCVFWKSISEVDENGNMKGLNVSIRPIGGSGPSKHQSLSEDSTYNCQEGLSCHQDYRFIIHARNDIGSSKLGSELTIIGTKLGLEPPTFRVERDPNITSQVTVKWQYPQTLNPSYFTLVWCRKSGGFCVTNELIQWETVSAKTTMYTWNLTYPDDFMYGVSATTPQGQSGLHWESCIYTQNISPSKAPQNVAVTVGAQDNSLVVTWNKLTCEPGQPYITYYNIQYCELDNMYCNNASVQATETLLVLKDLSEGVKYSVAVQGVTINGLSGPLSYPAYGIPVNKSLKPGVIAGIVVSTIVALVVAVLIVFQIRRCKKRVSKTLEQAREVKIPEDPGYEHLRHQEPYHNTYTGLRISTRSIERQDSGDSGYDPMTPPVDKVDKMEKLMIVRPDGYAMATMQNGNCDMFNSSQSINSLHEMEDTNSLIFDMRNRTTEPGTTFPPVNNVVNTVHETRMKAPAADKTAKTLKSKTHNDNTSVKTATITVNKDYGIGEGYSKATLFVSNEREDSVKSSNTSNTSVTEVNISPSINNNDLSSASDYVTASKHDSVVSESGEKISNSSMLRQDNVDGNVKNEAPSEGFDMSNICQLDTIPHPVMDSGGSDSISFEAYSCSDLKGSLFDNNRKQNKTQENNTTQPTDAYVSHGCSVGSNSLLDGTDTSPGFDSFPNSGPIVSSSLELPSAAPAASLADESLAVAPTFTSPKPSEQFSLPQLNSIPTPSSIAFSEGDQYVYTSSGEDERTILYTGKDKPHVKSDCSGSFSLLQDAGGQGYVSAPNNLQASALSHTSTNLNSSPSNKQESLTSVVCQHTLAANPAEQGYVTSETCQQAVRSNPIPAEQRYVTSETCQQAPVANPIPAAQRYVTSETCLQAPVANSIPTNQEYVMPETCQQDQVANPQNSDDAGGLSSCSGDPAYVSHPPELLASFSGQEREGLNVGTSSYVDQTFAQREEPNSELNRFSDSRGGCIPSSLPGSGGYVDKTFALSQNISPKDNPISFEEQSKRNNCITQPVEFGHSVKTLAVQDKNLNETHNDMPPSGPTPSPQSNNNIGYVDQTVLSQQPWHVIPHSAVTQQPPPMGPQITVSDPKLSNGYVDESFLKLAQGNKVKCSQGMNLSLQIGNRDRQENEGEERSEKDSDSGLSSMEQRSPETEEKQQDVFVQK